VPVSSYRNRSFPSNVLCRRTAVNAAAAAIICIAGSVRTPELLLAAPGQLTVDPLPGCTSSAALAALFVPPHPQIGRYELCTTAAPLSQVAPQKWAVQDMSPLDAFGSGGAYDRNTVSRLYGGRQASVVRGWVRVEDHLESLTFISPYPDRTLSELLPGTLIIRLIICCT
jgi:hypothetical protein